jgi:hypothetical protein
LNKRLTTYGGEYNYPVILKEDKIKGYGNSNNGRISYRIQNSGRSESQDRRRMGDLFFFQFADEK